MVNEASEGMMEKQNSIAKLRFKVGDIKRMEKVSEMIRESQKTQANVAEVERFSIKRCHLGESVLISKSKLLCLLLASSMKTYTYGFYDDTRDDALAF